MIALSHTLCSQAIVQIHCGTVIIAILLNFSDPVFVRDPLIQHRVITTNCIQEGFHSFLPGAHFLDE
jgi:hypothetical protein